jgi:cytochrome c2
MAPQKDLPGTTMPFAGIPDQQERSDLIAYLETLK